MTDATHARPPLPPSQHEWALFLDFDGTLTPLVDHPDGVMVDQSLRDLLQALSERLDGALAVVSGRSISDLDYHLAPLKLACAGQHGAERRDAAGRYQHAMDSGPLESVRQRLNEFADAHHGLMVEDKGASLAVHYRGAPELADTVVRHGQTMVDELGSDFELHQGKCVVEIKSSRCHKGLSVETFMNTTPFSGRQPIFVGDDATDENGFASAQAMGGFGIKVGDGETRADFRLADTEQARQWLEECLATLKQ
ncbi:trehalose 6-phosphatase [Kushneria sinocarnis]|uniref:Trehalose 6-phosphate phosphatase n=1 Tax=Kushneria sinocarnis TaxID=595502 RepID=A0A420WY62_9GAMM|nr:trehalose-phosphatase [Kushneria sinocarnis]RKR06164.1 trehalose 6-phosphatase [Kushneria sinocarnis]